MSAYPTHDLAVKVGEYQDRSGQTKGRWQRIGTVFKHDDGGTSIKLDAIPVGVPDWNGWVSVFKRDDQKQGQQGQQGGYQGQQPQQQHRGNGQQQHAPPPQQDFDDDIPF